MGMVKHSQSYQNSKFAMSLQYLEKEVRPEVGFLHADKHQSFLQVYFNTLVKKVSYKGPSINYMRSNLVIFRYPSPPLYAFKQYNDVIKTIDVRFCLDPLSPSLPKVTLS